MISPKVSIIVPTYNREKILVRSIESVLNQTYKDFELIVVDDCSTDNTESIINRIADARVKYIKLEENKGAANARNVGIRNAKGSYIAFQDSDVTWFENKLEKQMDAFYKVDDDSIGLVYCRYIKELASPGKKIIIPEKNIKINLNGDVNKYLLSSNFIDTPSCVIKKECFVNCGVFDTDLTYLEDWELFLRITKKYNVEYVDKTLYISHFSENSLNQQKLEQRAVTHIQIYNKHKKDYHRFPNIEAKMLYKIGRSFFMINNKENAKKYLLLVNNVHRMLKASILIAILNNSVLYKYYLILQRKY